jgi:hypothetical protein
VIEALVRDCIDVDGVARLFRGLGYPVHVREVRPEALDELGLRRSPLRVLHLARHGGVDLYAGCPANEEERLQLRELERALAERNHVMKTVVVEIGDGKPILFSIHSRCGRARRRLDVDATRPSADVVDRICGLMLRGRDAGESDPGLLFERALDREAVGRRFFEHFRRATGRFAAALSEACPTESIQACRDEALLLLSRVLFVYLIQRKGWLDGDHRFVRERLAACVRRGRPFHETILAPLFFDCLNTPPSRRTAGARSLGRIPYLNGGLFEPSAFERRNERAWLSNEDWRDVLDSTFEPFSLSVSEADEEGAHVDPEMLGKVFEQLMEDEERVRTGSFYTPREVVDRLTTSAIVRWCAEGDETTVRALAEALRGSETDLDPARASKLLRRLESIAVLDPACGSGAFLLAALRAIESLTRLLMAVAGEIPPPDLRARIAASALFGVDVKMEAVRLCELRIWLAIVSVSDVDIESVPPLPNLDRNVLQGNSLVGPLDFMADERTGIYGDWVRGLRRRKELLDAYRRSSSSRRRALGARLRESDEDLARALLSRSRERDLAELALLRESARGLFEGAPGLGGGAIAALEARVEETSRLLERLDRGEIAFFSFDLHFADVLARGGFSVVLGNPPWVRGGRVEPGLRRLLADRYRSFSSEGSGGFRQAELAMAFVEKSLSLAAPDGVVAQLVPSKVTSADYARVVREALTSRASVAELIDWSTDGRSLFGADVFPLGIVATKANPSAKIELSTGDERFAIDRVELSVNGAGSAWSLLPPDIRAIVRKIRERFGSLEEVLGRKPVMGVKTGANSTFFLDEVEILEGRVAVPSLGVLPAGAVVRAVRGRDLVRWKAVDSTWMLWPSALAGDRRLVDRVAKQLGIAPSALRLSYARSEHLGLKVAWKDVSRGLHAAILPDRVVIGGSSFAVVPNQTLYSIDVATRNEGLVIAAMLNSTVANALALEAAERAKDHHWRYLATVIGGLPFPAVHPGDETGRELARIARRSELGEGDEEELNLVVARLYGVAAAELRLFEEFVRHRLGRHAEAGS